MNPKIIIDTGAIGHNMRLLTEKCGPLGISVTGVTKGCCGNAAIAEALAAAGAAYIGDSRVENLKKLKRVGVPKVMLRLPMPSEVKAVVEYADYSLNTEADTVAGLSREALSRGKKHKVILMIDVGDLREGIWYEDESRIYALAESTLKCKGVELAGIGTNLTCFGGVIPTVGNYTLLVLLAEGLRRRYGIPLPVVSCGNSSCIHLLYENSIPEGITNLRINQAVLNGRELAYGKHIAGWKEDCFVLRAEIIEVMTKPSMPKGEIAAAYAFGKPVPQRDKGVRKRAILAVGRQDIDHESLLPLAKNAEVAGASSDHLIVDVTDCPRDFKAGDTMDFAIRTYKGLISGMISPYIQKTVDG